MLYLLRYLEYDPTAAAVDEYPDAEASMSYFGSDHTFLNREVKVIFSLKHFPTDFLR